MEDNKFSIEDLRKVIGKFDLEETEKEWIARTRMFGKEHSINVIINKNWINNKLDELNQFKIDKLSLYDCNKEKKANYFEHPIRIRNESFFSKVIPKFHLKNLQFEISSPTINYSLFLYLSKGLGHFESTRRLYIINETLENNENIQFSDFVNRINKSLKIENTLKIESNLSINYEEFPKLADSYLFYCAYNGNSAISRFDPFKFGEKLVNYGSFYSPMEIICKNLENELIICYKKAIISDDPFIEFISFYHIIEYYFNLIMKEFRDKTKFIIPEFQGSEKDFKNIFLDGNNLNREKIQLELVLRKFIDQKILQEELENYYGFSYFTTNEVRFANADPIGNDFYKSLAKRIYSVRNALVHRKEEHKSKYLPFREDHTSELRKENTLMRAIANQIILKSSK